MNYIKVHLGQKGAAFLRIEDQLREKRFQPGRVEAVLFDFDGTLTHPGALDFPGFKKSIGCPADQPVLEYIENLDDPVRKADTLDQLDHFETEGAENTEPNDGAESVIRYLRSKGLRLGIISRNSRKSIHRAFQNFKRIDPSDFDVIFSRNEPMRPKPDPEGILKAARELDVDIRRVLVVGDFVFDIEAGHAAGATTVYLDPKDGAESLTIEPDYRIQTLEEIKKLVRMTTPLPPGKFPNDLLKDFFDRFNFEDPSVLVRPGVGEDTAAIDIRSEEVLVLKSDPITFATDAIGQYAVLVNANDIATAGARPRWFLTTLLFPPGTTAAEIWHAMKELHKISTRWGITLCGGHTEITDAVTRPVITGMLAGTVKRKNLIDKGNIRPGDQVLLTKALAVEGTAIIAREFGDRLEDLGMAAEEVEACRQFLAHISILKEAEIAAAAGGVSAMHDITEGGLATALKELSISGRHRIRIHMDRIPVFPQTEKIARLLDIDPMGLIGSGSLLICCRQPAAERILKDLRNQGIQGVRIGEILDPGEGILAEKDGSPVPWPCFEVDEIARLS